MADEPRSYSDDHLPRPAPAPAPAGDPRLARAPRGTPRLPWLRLLVGCGGLLVLVALILGGMVLLGTLFTQPITTAGDRFLAALRDGDFAQAYAQCVPTLQEELGDPQQLARQVQTTRPATWKLDLPREDSGAAEMTGQTTLANGRAAQIRLGLEQRGDVWQINHF